METVSFGGWTSCVRLANEEVELIAPTEVGPRVVRFGRPGGPNLLREFPDLQGLTGGEEWRVFGGHRLWHAPEHKPRSYQPDNAPLALEELPHGVELTQPVELATGIRKQMRLELLDGAHVRVVHTLANQGMWPVSLAPWALTIMAPGGTAVIPQPPQLTSDHLLPNRTLVLWPYTRLNDPRLQLGERYLRIQMDPAIETPTKIGTQISARWCGYVVDGSLFLKVVVYQPSAIHPDFNSSVEVYTAGDFLELETLGALVELQPGEETSHIEHWFLLDGADASSEDRLEETVAPLVQEAMRRL